MPTRKDKNNTNKSSNKPVTDSQIPIGSSETQTGGNNSHTSEKPQNNKQRRKHPQTINIGSIPKIDVIEGEEANRIARNANKIAIWSIGVAALLFIATLAVFNQTVFQTKATLKADSIAQHRN